VDRGEPIGGAVEAAGDPHSVEALGAEATARAFARALLGRDPLAAAALFSTDARLITPDGTEICGRAEIAAILTQVTTSIRPLEIRAGRTTVCGTVALSSQRWRRREPTPGGHEATTTARLVLARTSGRWKIVIASPWE
jgi:ketosteroid isomerase-like protein